MQPNPEKPSPSPAATDVTNRPDKEKTESAASGIPPGIRRSNEAFRRDLPELLKNKKLYRKWVAYHGDERIGIARSSFDLYEACLRKGLKEEEFVVRCIIPDISEDEESLAYWDV
jgi:hypothetical protein